MLLRFFRPRALPRASAFKARTGMLQRRTLIAAPKPGDGPLMSRQPNRELPEIPQNGMRWLRSGSIFVVILISSCLAIFNYQKSSSSVVSSTLYALRTNPKAREYLGDNIYFAHQMPWIWGEMNQLHGRIDIHFEVKGTKNTATMKFTSFRRTRMGMFETTEWSLETYETYMENGEMRRKKIDLLDGSDPFKALEVDEEEVKVVGRGSYAPDLSK